MLPLSIYHSLEELTSRYEVSRNAMKLCIQNHFDTVQTLLAHYRKYRTFVNTKNCNNRIDKELTQLCEVLSKNLPKDEQAKPESKKRCYLKRDISIDTIIDQLSTRTFNVCQNVGLDTVNKVIKYYNTNRGFSKLRNCGTKSAAELIELCNKFGNNLNAISLCPEREQTSALHIIATFNPFKKAALNRHLEFLFRKLSSRAQKGMLSLIKGIPTCKDFVEIINRPGFKFHVVKNIGAKTAQELERFSTQINNFIVELQGIEDAELSRQYLKLILHASFSEFPAHLDQAVNNVFTTNNKLQLFKLIEILVNNQLIFNESEQLLFNFRYNKSNNKSIDIICQELNLTKERVRQIKNSLQKDISLYFKFIVSIHKDDLVDYTINASADFIQIDEDLTNRINSAEAVNYNLEFYAAIFSLLYNRTYAPIEYKDSLLVKNRKSNPKKLKNVYLIEKNIAANYNFPAMLESVGSILQDKITEDYLLHFEGYLMQFNKLVDKNLLPRLRVIGERILFNEFDLVVNAEGYLVFERNSKKPLSAYIDEVMRSIGKMGKIETIVTELQHQFPWLNSTEIAVRATLVKEKQRYIYIGRTSTYGLKEWENENATLKGGTIRGIVEEYLETHAIPQHIHEIVKYVNIYRNTSTLSIIRNIQAQQNNPFLVFPGNFIGLKRKKYNRKDIDFKKISGSHFKAEALKKFDGWEFNNVVKEYVRNYNYKKIQVISILQGKINSGHINLTRDNKLRYEPY